MEKDPMRSAQETVNEQTRRAGKTIEQAQQNASTGIDNVADHAAQSDSPTIQRAAAKAKEIADDLRTKDTGEIVQDAKNTVSNLTTQASQTASQLGEKATDTANSAMNSTASSMQTLAQTVRENAPSGKVGEYAHTTATALEKGADYLQHTNVDDVRNDLEALIRRRPVESLLVGLGIGFLLARAFRR
jgi:vacuolar-type H+-ATPase subunit H